MERIEELCCYYVALVRSIYLVHQNHHWITKGENFYGNHLLFERIYKTAADDADLAAEKFIGLFGTDVLDLSMQAQMIGKIMGNFASGDPIGTSLRIEKKFLDFSEKFYRMVKDEGKMTLGLDDMIMAIASNREAAVYLLKQASGSRDVMGDEDMNSKMAARMKLLNRIKNALPADAGVVASLRQKLQTLWTSIVISYVPQQYESNDLTVDIDTNATPARILANARFGKMVAPEVTQKIEDNFKRSAIAMLPPEFKNSMIAVGFAMPSGKPLPARPTR
jgi:hypothetical protein